ncbi:response regulator [Lutibacter sp.]
MREIKVFIVDDHKIIRDGIFLLLIGATEIIPVGEAESGKELFEKIESTLPDVLLLDISLPGMSGIEISKKIAKEYPNIKVLILSRNTDENTILAAIKAGVRGFLSKDTSKEELANAIKAVSKGNNYFGTNISKTVFTSLIKNTTNKENTITLTKREIEVAIYISDGLSYKEIASKMSISARTVESHRNHILSKLHLKTTIDLVKYVIKNQLIVL